MATNLRCHSKLKIRSNNPEWGRLVHLVLQLQLLFQLSEQSEESRPACDVNWFSPLLFSTSDSLAQHCRIGSPNGSCFMAACAPRKIHCSPSVRVHTPSHRHSNILHTLTHTHGSVSTSLGSVGVSKLDFRAPRQVWGNKSAKVWVILPSWCSSGIDESYGI